MGAVSEQKARHYHLRTRTKKKEGLTISTILGILSQDEEYDHEHEEELAKHGRGADHEAHEQFR